MQRANKSMEAKYLQPSLELVEDVFTKNIRGINENNQRNDVENTRDNCKKIKKEIIDNIFAR